VGSAFGFEKGEFQIPSFSGYTLERVRELDKDNPPDGVPETLLEIHQGPGGARLGRYVTGGRVWAYAVFGNPGNIDDSGRNYAILDSDGDGVFDERYRYRGEEFHLPRWAKDVR
jgi:hypothetical protein